MAKPKGEEILRKQKEAKQKKLLLVLAPIFLILIVWQAPGYVKMLTGGDEPVATTTETPTTPVGTTPDPATAPPPSTSAPGGVPVPGPTETPAELTDSDRPTAPEAGQLISFDRFVGKDPFRQIVDMTPPAPSNPTVTPPSTDPGGSGGNDNGGGSDGNADDGGDGGGDTGGGNGNGNGGGGDDDPVVPTAAVLVVNGVKETVPLEGTFPKSEQLFVLRKLSESSAWIGLVAGEYSNGKKSIEVEVGEKLNLVSQPDGIRYTIKVVKIRLR
jgi:hypothetical protein